jgi:hypothetical protein
MKTAKTDNIKRQGTKDSTKQVHEETAEGEKLNKGMYEV